MEFFAAIGLLTITFFMVTLLSPSRGTTHHKAPLSKDARRILDLGYGYKLQDAVRESSRTGKSVRLDVEGKTYYVTSRAAKLQMAQRKRDLEDAKQ